MQKPGRQPPAPCPAPAVASNELTDRNLPTLPREALLLLTLLNHPWLIAEAAEEIAALRMTSPGRCHLRDALLSYVADENSS